LIDESERAEAFNDVLFAELTINYGGLVFTVSKNKILKTEIK